MAKAYPGSEFVGYDYHPASIDTARQRAKDADTHNARFEVADASGYADTGFDLITFFDCLHDMADPVGAARHAREALKADGNCMIVEPAAGVSEGRLESLTLTGAETVERHREVVDPHA